VLSLPELCADSMGSRKEVGTGIFRGLFRYFLNQSSSDGRKNLIITVIDQDECFYDLAQKAINDWPIDLTTNKVDKISHVECEYKLPTTAFKLLDAFITYGRSLHDYENLTECIVRNIKENHVLFFVHELSFNKVINKIVDKIAENTLILNIYSSSKCDVIFKRMSMYSGESISILNLANQDHCYSNYIRLFHDEKESSRDIRKINGQDNPIIIVSERNSKRMTLPILGTHECYYNPLSNLFYVTTRIGHVDITHNIYQLMEYLTRPINIFVTYGSTKEVKRQIDILKEKIRLIFPYANLLKDKEIENYNTDIEEYEEKLANGDIIIVLINKKFIQSIYAMRELSRIYEINGGRLPNNAIILKDDSIKKLLVDTVKTDEYVFKFWEKEEVESQQITNNQNLTEEGRIHEKNKLNNCRLINKHKSVIIRDLKDNYDHKTIKEHERDGMLSILWAIYRYMTIDYKYFDLYNKASSSDFKLIVAEVTSLSNKLCNKSS
jgi:hypothetical protein